MIKFFKKLGAFILPTLIAFILTGGIAFADRTFTLPNQTGQSGKFLQTNGTNPLWATAGGGGTVTGTGVANEATFWTGVSSIGGNADWTFNNGTEAFDLNPTSGSNSSHINAHTNSLVLTHSNGTNTSGVSFGSNLFNILNNGHTWHWPGADGTSGQSLTTDGAGNLSFASLSPSSLIGTPTQIPYFNNSTGALTSDSSATRDSTTKFTNIQATVGTGITSGFNIGNSIFGFPINGGNLFVNAADGNGGVFAGDGTGAGKSDVFVAIISKLTAGNTSNFSVDATGGVNINSGTAPIQIQDDIWPSADGSSGQAIVTDGAGNLSFANVGMGTVTGTGTANQAAYWTSSSNITSDGNFLWNPTTKDFTAGLNGAGNTQILVSNTGAAITATSPNFYSTDGAGHYAINVTTGANPVVTTGDASSSGHGNLQTIDDGSQIITDQLGALGNFKMQDNSGHRIENATVATGNFADLKWGDLDALHSNSILELKDSTQTLSWNKANFTINGVPYVFPGAGASVSGYVLSSDTSDNLTWAPQTVMVSSSLFNVWTPGTGAGASLTTGTNNILLGQNAGNLLTNTSGNIFLGQAGVDAMGTDNVGLGQSTLSISTGANNFAVNFGAGNGLTTGNEDFLAGYQAGTSIGSGSNDVCIGHEACMNGTGGNGIIAISDRAGQNATGDNDQFLGSIAGRNVTTGQYDILQGYNSGQTLITGNNDVLLGISADVAASNTSGAVALGFGAIAATNEFAIADTITNWKFQGDSYTLPTAFPVSNGMSLTSTTAGVMTWAFPSVAWSSITGTPTTIAGYGITDAQSKATSGDLLAQTGAVSSIATLTSPNDGVKHTYSLGAYLNITAVTLDVVQEQVTYTDENGTSQTENFFPSGLTSGGVGTVGNFPMQTMNVRVNPNTAITIKSILTTGTGSIAYDVGGTIQLLK